MTLAEIIPSLRSSLPRRLEPGLWPSTAQHLPDGGDVSVGGASLIEVAARYGTPAVVVDVAEFRRRCAGFGRGLGDIDVCCSGGSLLVADTASVIHEQGLRLGIYCEAQLAAVVAAAFPADRLIVYGDSGRASLLRRAMTIGVGQIVVASMSEIEVAARMSQTSRPQPVSLSISTGTVDGVSGLSTHRRRSRGFSINSGEAGEAVRRIVAAPGLRLVGVQCRLDAPFATAAPFELAGREGLEFVRAMRDESRAELSELHLGGGHDTPMQPGGQSASCAAAARLRRGIAQVCAELLLPAPHVTIEPGPSLAGPAALTICRVLAVRSCDERATVEVDAQTGAVGPAAQQHAVRAAHLLNRLSPSPDIRVEVVASGSFGANGAGAVLARDTLLPADIAEGDLLAMPSIGNTDHSPLSHRLPRPALVAVADGRSWSLARRRSAEDVQRPRRVS